MKKGLKNLALVGMVGMTLAGCGFSVKFDGGKGDSGNIVSTKSIKTGTQVFVYGVSNDANMTSQLKQYLHVDDNKTKQLVMTPEKMTEVGLPTTNNTNIWSSVKLSKAPANYGVQVDIKTPSNITLITAPQYRNAAIDLGVSDVLIEVASVKSATGEGALAGVIVGLQDLNARISEKQVQVAQKGLDTVGEVLKENPNVNPDNLAQAVNDTKSELLQANNSDLSNAQIHQIVTNNITNNNVVINDKSVNKLTNYFEDFNKTPEIVNNPEIKENVSELKELGQSAYNGLQKSVADFSTWANSEEGQGFFESVGNFLTEVGRGVAEFLNGFFSGQE